MKAIVKLGLEKMSAAGKIAFATNVGYLIVNNGATFPSPPVDGLDMADFAASVGEAFTVASAARATYRTRLSEANGLLRQLDGMLRRDASYVQTVSAGNAAIIGLAGLDVRNAPGKIGPLSAPAGLASAPSTNPGTVSLKWAHVKHAASYRIEYAATADFASASQGDVLVTRARGTVAGLASGTRYWFRVAAIGAAGPSLWTSAISVVTQ